MSRKVAEEVLPRLRQRYADRGQEGHSLLIDEVCEQWGYSRKRAIKILETIERKPQATPSRAPVVDERVEAESTRPAFSQAPVGRNGWNFLPIADKLVEPQVVDSISHETVRTAMKKDINPWLSQFWCIPPMTAFVATMEEVISVYERPADEHFPLACHDESERSGDSLPQATRRAERSDGNSASSCSRQLGKSRCQAREFSPVRGAREALPAGGVRLFDRNSLDMKNRSKSNAASIYRNQSVSLRMIFDDAKSLTPITDPAPVNRSLSSGEAASVFPPIPQVGAEIALLNRASAPVAERPCLERAAAALRGYEPGPRDRVRCSTRPIRRCRPGGCHLGAGTCRGRR